MTSKELQLFTFFFNYLFSHFLLFLSSDSDVHVHEAEEIGLMKEIYTNSMLLEDIKWFFNCLQPHVWLVMMMNLLTFNIHDLLSFSFILLIIIIHRLIYLLYCLFTIYLYNNPHLPTASFLFYIIFIFTTNANFLMRNYFFFVVFVKTRSLSQMSSRIELFSHDNYYISDVLFKCISTF